MSALEDICFLEQQIHEQIRAKEDYEGRARRAKTDIKVLQAKIEAADKDVRFHQRNVRFVQEGDTPHVNIKDFAKTKQNLQKALDLRDNARVMAAQAEGVVSKCQGEIAAADRRISGLRVQLSEYGQVIEFPGKKESDDGPQ